MDRQYEPIHRLLALVRARYRALTMCRAIVRAALAASAVVGLSVAAASLASLATVTPWPLAAVGGIALVTALAAVAWGLLPLRHKPSDTAVARFIEERVPALDDRLATAVDVVQSHPRQASPILTAPFVADVARRAADVDVNVIVPGEQLRRSGVRAGAAALVLLVLAIVAREPARQSVDAASLVLFPMTLRLDVRPGDARVKQGTPLAIAARIAGNRAPVSARVEVSDGGQWRRSEMSAGAGQFQVSLPPAIADFKYRVAVGALVSPIYQVSVVHPPRVTRIDVDYTYPPALDLKSRTETDGGDLYAPAGTAVRLHVFADRPVATGRMSLSNGASIDLAAASVMEMTAAMKITEDGSYRIALADREGVTEGAPTEYFIRVLDDRPPDVHIVKPASDRSVTALEEVEIEAQADDDYGLERVELVYAIRGQTEKAVLLDVPRRATTVTVHHMLYLEDLGVRPGDFVSYYVRARDITRGARPNEGKSDIFFLEVRPYEQEFALEQSQSMAGAGYSGSIDDLVNAQKQIVVATWKLDRRGGSDRVRSARSPQDVRAIGRSEAELKTRAEETASSLRESTMRDPRRRLQGRGSDPSGAPRIGQTMPEEDAMTRAVEAMGRAVTALEAVDTGSALPPEMQALNALLEAQALVKKRQVSRQQSAQGGPGSNNRNYDISTLFDRELQRLQQTSYETRQSPDRKRADNDLAEKIKKLAQRQDELLKRQEELARQPLGEEERKRQIERLSREQTELRQQAEEMARQMSKLQGGQSRESGPPAKAQPGADQTSRQLQEIADDMRRATGELRRLDSNGGRAKGNDALEKLKSLERRLRGGEQDRPVLGDLQLEARQLADAQRQIASSVPQSPSAGAANTDRLRQLAGEQERLAQRARRLQDGARQSPSTPAASVLAGRRLAERMQQSAEALRKGAQDPQSLDPKREARAEEQIARDLDKAADLLQAGGNAKDRDSTQLSDALARATELREKLDAITRDLQKPGTSGQRNQLRDEAARELQRAQQLIDDLRRQDPSLRSGGPGFTYEGQGMTFSSPGTEGFKQDFARWQQLRDQATGALARVESALSKQLQDRQAADRLAAGVDDKAPAAYRSRVDDYFKAIAAKKTP
jgi:uncharacterized protein DUF4175